MKRRSFLATLAAFPVFVKSNWCDPKALPKITSVSIETEFQTATIFTGGIFEYDPLPPPKYTIKASYDDGSVRYFEGSECEYSFEFHKEEKVSECDIVGNDMIVRMAYARETDRTPSVTCVYKNIKEIYLGD
jgi:hypothetical protein